MVTDNGRVNRPDSQPSNRKWWIIGGVLITLFSALIVTYGVYLQSGQIRHTVTRYEVVDDQTVTVSFVVHRPPDTAVVCRVRAIAIDFSTVGTLDVEIPADAAGGARDVAQEVTLRTTTRANTGTVSKCVPEGNRSQ